MRAQGFKSLAQEAQKLKQVVFGEPGSGKTWYLASGCLCPETTPTLILDYYGQAASLISNPEYAKALEDGRLLVWTLESYDDLTPVYNWLRAGKLGLNKKLDELAGGQFPKLVAIDSLTELQRREIIRRAGGNPDRWLTDVPRPQIQDWGALLDQFSVLGRRFMDLDMHVILSCLEKVELDDQDRIHSSSARRVALQGQACVQVPAQALTVMRLTTVGRPKGAYTVGICTATGVSVVKDQTGRLPARIENPTVAKVLKYLKGG